MMPIAIGAALTLLLLFTGPLRAELPGCLSPAVVDSASEIHARWKQHEDELDCPVSGERNATPDTRVQSFRNGQVAYASRPNMTRSLVATITRKDAAAGSSVKVDDRIKVFWRESGSTYDRWLLVWKRDYSPAGTAQLLVGSTVNFSAGGSCTITSSEGCAELVGGDGGAYTISLQGCRLTLSGSTILECSILDSVSVQFGGIDLFDVPAAQTFQEAEALHGSRAEAVNRFACRRGLGFEEDKHFGEDITAIMLAKLYFASNPATETPGTTYPDCAVPGDRFQLAAEVDDFLSRANRVREVGTDLQFGGKTLIIAASAAGMAAAGALIGAAIGSAIPGLGTVAGAVLGGIIGGIAGLFTSQAVIKCVERPGDWDMTLVGLVRVLNDYGHKLDPEVRLHVLQNLLSEKGGADKVKTICTFCIWKINETENHILQTESSRYLSNQLWAGYLRSLGGTPADEFINSKNGLRDWLLGRLKGLFSAEFHEYNARPYSGHSIRALQNLSDYAEDPEVMEAARMLLHYLSAKFAVSNNGLRRSAPFRRHFDRCGWVGSDNPNLWSFGRFLEPYADLESWRMLVMIGNHQIVHQAKRGHAHPNTMTTMVHASQTRYRPGELIAGLSLNRSQNTYLQRHRHEGTEIYFSSGRFLISGGGTWEDNLKSTWPSNTVTDLYGCALPTSVILTDSPDDDIRTMLRFEGETNHKTRSNICVGPNFACGFQPRLPDNLPLHQACLISTDPASPVFKPGLSDDPHWRFIDFESCWKAGVWAAVYVAPCSGNACRDDNGRGQASEWGFAEVVDSDRAQTGFLNFMQQVLANNAGRTFHSDLTNTYSTTAGIDLVFTPRPAAKDRLHIARISDVSGYPKLSGTDLDTWRSANGALFPNDVVAGSRQIIFQEPNATCIMIDNPGMRRRLILDFHDTLRPWSREYPLPVECRCGPNGRQGYCPER